MHSFVEKIAKAMAVIGGLVLTMLIVLTCISVTGRGINTFSHWAWFETTFPGLSASLIETGVGPILGDFELVEAGIAFAIFSFLPICQLHSSHATVDVFTSMLPKQAELWLKALWEVVFAVVIILIAVKLYDGMSSKIRNGETTFLLQFKVWWSYALSLLAAMVAALVAVYCALVRIKGAVAHQEVLTGEGAVH
ncbi:MAG: TRAP transporter small permease subunit [Gammaproteobacteria bacterium]|nr:TRAP transporter small permease subunit [Gammaproteobacteria bacterium]